MWYHKHHCRSDHGSDSDSNDCEAQDAARPTDRCLCLARNGLHRGHRRKREILLRMEEFDQQLRPYVVFVWAVHFSSGGDRLGRGKNNPKAMSRSVL